jgi:hypothetical protein
MAVHIEPFVPSLRGDHCRKLLDAYITADMASGTLLPALFWRAVSPDAAMAPVDAALIVGLRSRVEPHDASSVALCWAASQVRAARLCCVACCTAWTQAPAHCAAG